MKKFIEIIKNKWLIKGTTTILLAVIIIACYIGLTVLADKLEIEDLDFTEKKLYSLSDETKNKLKDLDEEITIQLINIDDEYIKEYTRKYKVYSDKIDIEEVDDLSSRVDLKTEYNLDENPIEKLTEIYIRINELCKEDEIVLEACRDNFKKLEDKDPYCVQLWTKFKNLSLKEFNKTYDILGIKFDSTKGEAFYADNTVNRVFCRFREICFCRRCACGGFYKKVFFIIAFTAPQHR